MATLNIVPPTLDIFAYGGDTTTVTFSLADDAGDPYQFIGIHTASIRPDANSETSWDIEITTGENGAATLVVPAAVAAEIVVDATTESIYVGEDLITGPMFTGVWDWQYDNNGEIRTLIRGKITVIGEVTR